MKELENQEEHTDFRLTKNIRDKQQKMLAFMYNVEYQIAADKFDQKFHPYSELKIRQKSQVIKTEEVTRILNALSEKLHQRILRQNIECDRALNKLQTLWQTMKIQPFHRYYVEKYLYSTYVEHLPSLIKNQDILIRKEQHIYYSILRAIWARQACLNHISRQLKKYNPEDMYEHFHTLKERQTQRNRKIQQRQYRVHGYRALYRLDQQQANLGKTKMEQLFQDINNYRKLTVHAIELIKSWREYICSLTHDLKKRKQRIQYYYQEKNYLLSLLNDSKFIANTFLINFFTFSLRNDPFLLRPILSLQKKMTQAQQLSFQQLQLYHLIQVKPQELIKIMASVQLLYNQLETNIRNRKIFHPSVLNKVKSMSLEPIKAHNCPEESPANRIKLEPITSQKSVALKNGLGTKHPSQITMTKSNVILRKSSEVNKPTNTLYGRSFNPERSNPFKMIQSQKLKSLKEEVFKKVKEDLQYQTKKSLIKSKEFEELIDLQVRKNMYEILWAQKRELAQAVLQVTPISCKEEQMSSYLAYIYKLIPVNNLELQMALKQLSNSISDQSYACFLKITAVNQEIAHIIGKINRQIKGYKSIDILLIAFQQTYMLEKIILRVIEFIWKYQSAKEVVFTFRYSTSQNQQLLIKLKEGLSAYSTAIQKKIKKQTEIKFIFVKKAINQNHVYNPFPEKLHFKLYSALATDAIKLDTFRQNQQSHLYYEYILMEMLKRFTNSEDFMILRDAFKPMDRFRHLLKLLTDLQGQKKDEIAITTLSANTASDLNEQLTLLKKPHLQVSDLTTINNLKIILLQLTLTPAYSLKVMSTLKGQKMHRYHVHNTLHFFRDDDQTEYFVIDVQETHFLKILIFKADQYLKQQSKSLYRYLSPRIQKRKSEKKFIENLWVQMIRHPSKPTEKDSLYLQTFATDEFASINKHLYISDHLDWYTDIQIQNGFDFILGKGDVYLARPLGIGVMTNSGSVLYCRIIQ